MTDELMSVDEFEEFFDQIKDEGVKDDTPKNFFIRCHKCRWARKSSGVASDLADLKEMNKGCKNCGKWRKFHCPKCGTPATMKRIKGNS